MNYPLRVATVFSGVGSFEYALRRKKIPFKIVFACDNGERDIHFTDEDVKFLETIEGSRRKNSFFARKYEETGKRNHIKDTYKKNHNCVHWFEDIRAIVGSDYRGKIDVLTGGAPCQSFSSMGKRKGLEDSRGKLVNDFFNLIASILPSVFIFENVPGLLNIDEGAFLSKMKKDIEKYGYRVAQFVLNASDYGLPQKRRRLFMIGTMDKTVLVPIKSPLKKSFSDFIHFEAPDRLFLGKKGFEFVTNQKYRTRAEIDPTIMRTQRANQQFNWNGTFHFVPIEENGYHTTSPGYIGIHDGKRGSVRKLSPKECFQLMGFGDDFRMPEYVSDRLLYRMAGNSMAVNVLEAVIDEIFK